jgi:ubiquinone/menaquinone biosynthesis C-methylase UbiE
MNPEEYGRMHELETHYWWFVGRRAIVAALLRETLKSHRRQTPLSLLDIGCGTGANLPMLTETVGAEGGVVALDYSPLALQFAGRELKKQALRKSVTLLRGDATRLPFADGEFDVVTMLDVLEHVENDGAAVREIYRVLAPGGAFVLSVPAYQHLWSAHDTALHHFRRYEYSGLKKVLESGGFQVWRQSFAMSAMPPLAWLWRRFVLPFKPRRPQDATRHSEGAVLPSVPGVLNAALVKYLEIEGAVLRRRPLRFGTSLVAIARKVS